MAAFQRQVQRLARSIRRQGAIGTAKQILRDLAMPRGSRRDRVWATWGRPMLGALRGRPRPEPPVGTLTQWTSPANRLLGPQQQIGSILLVKVDQIGDFFLALPAFAKLRRYFPQARITLVCGSWNRAMAEKTGLFDEIRVLDFFISNRAGVLSYRGDPRMIADLKLPAYDIAIDLRLDEDTRGLLGHVRARCKVGYHSQLMPDDMSIVLPQPELDQPDDAPITAHYRAMDHALVDAVIALVDPLQDNALLLARIMGDEVSGAVGLRATWRGPVVAVNTASGREIKNWPLDNFIAVCRWITADLHGTVVLLGTAAQAKDAATLTQAVGGNVVNLVAQTSLERSLAIVRQADLFLGNDSSITHASAMMGVPTVGIYSGIDPISVWGPLGPQVTALRNSVPCSPCSLTYLTECTHGRACITGISVDTVCQAMQPYLNAAASVPAVTSMEPVG